MIMNYGIKIQWANITFFSSCITKRPLLACLATRNAPHNQVLVSIHFRLYPGWFTTCKGQYWKLFVVLRQPSQTNSPKSNSDYYAYCFMESDFSLLRQHSYMYLICKQHRTCSTAWPKALWLGHLAFICWLSDSDQQITGIKMAN